MAYHYLREYVENIAGDSVNANPTTEYVYKCPMRGCDDRRGHFYVNYEKGKYVCFKCGRGGYLTTFLRRYGIETDDAPVGPTWEDEILVKLKYLDVGETEDIITVPMGLENLPVTVPLNPECVLYLRNRNITEETCATYKFRSIDKGPYSRVFIPCYMHDEIVFWQARAIHPKSQPKYLQEQGSRKSEVLFNYDSAIHEDFDHVIICEGVFDAIRSGPAAVAIYGKECSEAQFRLLRDMKKRWYFIAFDGDALGHATVLLNKFKQKRLKARILAVPIGKDPDTFPLRDAVVLKTEDDVWLFRLNSPLLQVPHPTC